MARTSSTKFPSLLKCNLKWFILMHSLYPLALPFHCTGTCYFATYLYRCNSQSAIWHPNGNHEPVPKPTSATVTSYQLWVNKKRQARNMSESRTFSPKKQLLSPDFFTWLRCRGACKEKPVGLLTPVMNFNWLIQWNSYLVSECERCVCVCFCPPVLMV